MAEEAGAPENARGRLHGVQREPHDPAAEQGDGWIPPASGSRCKGRRPGTGLQINFFRRGLTQRDGPIGAPVVDAAPSVFPPFLFYLELFWLNFAAKVESVWGGADFIRSERGMGR